MKATLTIFFMVFSIHLFSQTYYGYGKKNDEDVTIKIEIVEPYKPINYAEIAQNFNNMLSKELSRREALKKYYDDIMYQTMNSINQNSVFTNDNVIDVKLSQMQFVSIEGIKSLNQALKTGKVKPEKYESILKSGYYDYMNVNQMLLNIYRLKCNKLKVLNNNDDKNNFIKKFDEMINNTNISPQTIYQLYTNLSAL